MYTLIIGFFQSTVRNLKLERENSNQKLYDYIFSFISFSLIFILKYKNCILFVFNSNYHMIFKKYIYSLYKSLIVFVHKNTRYLIMLYITCWLSQLQSKFFFCFSHLNCIFYV